MSSLSVYNEGVYNAGIYNLTLSGSEISIKLDGKSQYLGTSGPSILNVGNTWTLGFWAKPRANKEHASFFSTASNDFQNEISVSTTPIPEATQILGKRPAELRAVITDASGDQIKNYGWGNYFQTEVWTHVFLQWDGAELNAYKNGLPTTTGVVLTTTTGSMSDYPARKVYYGASIAGLVATFSGHLGHCAMWNSLLSQAEMNSVVSGGLEIDLAVPSGSYVSIGSLQHYWKPGQAPENLGADFAGSVDLDKQRNLNFGNVTADTP